MKPNWDLLAQLIASNRKTHEATDEEVVKTFLSGYSEINDLDPNSVEGALKKQKN